MEFPHLGQHCSDQQCRRLDFLPVKCDGCNKVFCSEHYSYSSHNCPVAYKKDVQVPVCPLCNRLVPGKADELPDIRVSRHIDSDCSSDTAVSRRKTVFTNKCSLKGCKQKELVPVVCDKCNQNFCLRHRHPVDHSCSNASGKSVSKAGQAALSRTGQTGSSVRTSAAANTGAGINPRNLLSGITSFRSGNSSRPQGTALSQNLNSLQGNVSEEQALSMAIQASMSTNPTSNPATTQEQEDFLLAKAIAESEMAAAGGETSSSSRRGQQNCEIC